MLALRFGVAERGMSRSKRPTLLVFAPTRRATSETFIRANLAGLPMRCIAYFGDEWSLLRPWQSLYATAIVMSKLLTQLGMVRAASWPAAFVAWLLIRRYRPDAVQAEFGFEAVRVMEASAWTGIPMLVHFRGSDASSRRRLDVLKERYCRLMSIADGVIVKSRPMADTLMALGAQAESILISPSGANTDLFHGSAPAVAPPVLLAVGRFVAKKGPLHTIRSFSQLCRELGDREPTLALWMVGDGPLLKPAQALVIALGLQDRVQFFGVQPQAKVAELMREVRGFVQHSLVAPDGDSEGNPVAVMEAQLSGLPVVATRHAGIPDVVLEGESGYLVDEGDEAAMAQAMSKLILEPELAATLGECGRRRIKERFTIGHHLNQITELIHQVITRNR